ncbi:MAG: SDR family oxidoreductase [Acidobacteria bacterium]|nr:SDR family oxidoreductase [Acidobacteriota bacterium]
MDNFKDKIAIVTGGASGIGQALCEALGASGACLIVADVNGEGAQQVAAQIRAQGGSAEAFALDVTSAEDVQRLLRETVAQHGRLDLIFNNAGVAVGGEVRDLSLADWRRIVDVNLMGVIYGTTAAYEVMVKQGFGHIVNTASLAGLLPAPFMVPYSATKHAVVGLSKSLRAEAADLGVKVTAICPGYIQTNIFDASPWHKLAKDDILAKIPFKLLDAKDAARLILRGVARNKALVIFPGYARIFWFLSRLSARLIAPLERKTIKDFRASRHE